MTYLEAAEFLKSHDNYLPISGPTGTPSAPP